MNEFGIKDDPRLLTIEAKCKAGVVSLKASSEMLAGAVLLTGESVALVDASEDSRADGLSCSIAGPRTKLAASRPHVSFTALCRHTIAPL